MLTALAVLLILIVLGFRLAGTMVRFCDKNIAFLLVLKWLIGHHHGRTNATFFRPGTKILHPSGRASKWSHKPGYYRLCVRWGVLLALGATLYGWFTARLDTEIALALAALVLLAYGQCKAYRAVRLAHHRRTLQGPLTAAVSVQLGMSAEAASNSVSFRPDLTRARPGETLGTIVLPDRFPANPGQREALQHLISSRLPVEVDYNWRTTKAPMTVLVRRAVELPSMARFSDWLPEIQNLGPRKYIAGVTRSGAPYTCEFGGDNPHHSYTWNTGRGKSTQLKNILAQVLGNEPDASAVIIDPKDISLDALRDVPGVTFRGGSHDIPGMWAGVEFVYDEMIRRYERMKDDPGYEPPSLYLVMEEINSFAVMSSVYWKSVKGHGDPATAPVWASHMAPIFWRARAARIYVVAVAQSLQERWLGNLNLRPSFGLMSLSGYKPSQWAQIVGTTPVPKSQKGRGRAVFSDGENESWVQCFMATDEEFREYAMTGRQGAITTGRP